MPALAHASCRTCCSAVSSGSQERTVDLGATPISRRPEARASEYFFSSPKVLVSLCLGVYGYVWGDEDERMRVRVCGRYIECGVYWV